MAFIADKEELKPGLIIFRRTDVAHSNWYCRVKVTGSDRYKTVSLKTPDINAARTLAWDQDGEVRYALKHDVPIFNRPFRDVAREYLDTQKARSRRGEISKGRPEKMRAVIGQALDEYVGSTQVHRIGDELWEGYPAWRRETGEGRSARNGVREISGELAVKLVTQELAMREKGRAARGFRARPSTQANLDKAIAAKLASPVPFVSDATIRFEMSIFASVMNYAIKKRYVPASQRYEDRPKLKIMRRDEFTVEEYRKLHSVGRRWIEKGKNGEPNGAPAVWYRTVTYNLILIACNTGMRPSELKNLRWRDITPAKDRDGREIVVLFVQGKGKSRSLVAPKSVSDYLDRIRAIAKKTAPNDRVFTTIDGKPTQSLYKHLIDDLLTRADLRMGPGGTIRSTYSFRHTYATFRLGEGVDVYFLAEQMGTSVKMIEDHYGHVNTIKHADRVLQGMSGWDPVDHATTPARESEAKASKGAQTRLSAPVKTKKRT